MTVVIPPAHAPAEPGARAARLEEPGRVRYLDVVRLKETVTVRMKAVGSPFRSRGW
jgi:hypothetical protein